MLNSIDAGSVREGSRHLFQVGVEAAGDVLSFVYKGRHWNGFPGTYRNDDRTQARSAVAAAFGITAQRICEAMVKETRKLEDTKDDVQKSRQRGKPSMRTPKA